jgi:hypothetical protein
VLRCINVRHPPLMRAPKSGRNLGKFQTAVRDLVSTTETPIGQMNLSTSLGPIRAEGPCGGAGGGRRGQPGEGGIVNGRG